MIFCSIQCRGYCKISYSQPGHLKLYNDLSGHCEPWGVRNVRIRLYSACTQYIYQLARTSTAYRYIRCMFGAWAYIVHACLLDDENSCSIRLLSCICFQDVPCAFHHDILVSCKPELSCECPQPVEPCGAHLCTLCTLWNVVCTSKEVYLYNEPDVYAPNVRIRVEASMECTM